MRDPLSDCCAGSSIGLMQSGPKQVAKMSANRSLVISIWRQGRNLFVEKIRFVIFLKSFDLYLAVAEYAEQQWKAFIDELGTVVVRAHMRKLLQQLIDDRVGLRLVSRCQRLHPNVKCPRHAKCTQFKCNTCVKKREKDHQQMNITGRLTFRRDNLPRRLFSALWYMASCRHFICDLVSVGCISMPLRVQQVSPSASISSSESTSRLTFESGCEINLRSIAG